LHEAGTTASVVKLWQKGSETKAVIANVGDSRVYIFRANGQLEPITLDDNEATLHAADDEQARRLQDRFSGVTNKHALNDWERVLFERRYMLSQAIGGSRIQPRTYVVDLKPGDRMLITSDGVTDNLTDTEIQRELALSRDSREAAERLTTAAQARSRDTNHDRKKPDDMSAGVIGVPVVENGGDHKRAGYAISSSERLTEAASLPGNFRIGDMVRVRRSSGQIESGWQIYRYEPDAHTFMVRTGTPGGNGAIRPVPARELIELNRSESPPVMRSLTDARNFRELYNALLAMDGLKGSEEVFAPEELIDIIEDVRAGTLDVGYVTRTEGLRDKVLDLLRAEREPGRAA
jgi:serine/threonine protein phosphatase PrpC